MDMYVSIVQKYPIYSAMLQFAILGTLGTCVARWVQNKRIYFPLNWKETIWFPISWAILAVLIKHAFIGFEGFLDILVERGLIPTAFAVEGSFWRALGWSIVMNLQFGPLLVLLHRWLDYLPFGKTNWTNIDKGLISLLWWWIPAHTVTFLLPPDLRVGLAAFWSVVLGFILGFFNRKTK